MIKFVFFLGIIALSSFSIGQELEVEWAGSEMTSGSIIKVVAGDTNESFVLRFNGNNALGYYSIERRVDGVEVFKNRLNLNFDVGFCSIQDVVYFNNGLHLIFSKKHHGKNFIYAQKLNREIEYVGGYRELASYKVSEFKKNDSFSLIRSENDTYIGVQWSRPVNRDFTNYGFVIFDENFNMVNNGEYPLHFRTKYLRIEGGMLSNHGDYILFFTELNHVSNRKASSNFLALNMYLFNDEGLEKFRYTFDDKRPVSFEADINDHELVVGGTYSDYGSSGAIGVFNLRMDRNDLSNHSIQYNLFQEDVLTKILSERELDQIERRMERRDLDNVPLNSFIVRDFDVSPDGQVTCVLENYYVQTQTVPFGMGTTNSMSYVYHYDDLLVYSFDERDTLKFMDVVSKHQVTRSPNAPYFSIYTIKKDSNWMIFFTDNASNYKESGDYDTTIQHSVTENLKRGSGVSLVNLDLGTGEIHRSFQFPVESIEVALMPRLFVLDQQLNMLYLYGKMGKNERFGILKF